MLRLLSSLVIFGLSSTNVVAQHQVGAAAFCENGSAQMANYTFELKNGPFSRRDGTHVGEMNLGIRRYPWSARTFGQFTCAVHGVEFQFVVRDSIGDAQNFVFFRVSSRQISGTIVLRNIYKQTVLRVFRPISEDRQQTIGIVYFAEQSVADVFDDVVFISSAWED